MSTPSTAVSEKQSRLLSVAVFLIIGFTPWFWYQWRPHVLLRDTAPEAAPPIPLATTVNWFQVIKLPEAPYTTKEVQFYQRRLSSWLDALKHEGYQVKRLSDVYETLRQGHRLAPKTIVLLFDPAYRHTYEAASSILSRTKTPAVWTIPANFQQGDRRFLSNYSLYWMKRSKYWDVGAYHDKSLALLNSQTPMTFGDSINPAWDETTWGQSLNDSVSFQGLKRLYAKINWDSQEFVNRLLSEIPPQGTSELTVRQAGDRLLGIVDSRPSSVNPPFALKAPEDKRAGYVAWTGTKGITDYLLQLDYVPTSGEFWLMLRSDKEKGESIRIGLTEDKVLVEIESNHERKPRASFDWTMNRARHTTMELRLEGTKMYLTLQGQDLGTISNLPLASSKSIVELMTYEKIRGTATADAIRLIFTPHTTTPNP